RRVTGQPVLVHDGHVAELAIESPLRAWARSLVEPLRELRGRKRDAHAHDRVLRLALELVGEEDGVTRDRERRYAGVRVATADREVVREPDLVALRLELVREVAHEDVVPLLVAVVLPRDVEAVGRALDRRPVVAGTRRSHEHAAPTDAAVAVDP